MSYYNYTSASGGQFSVLIRDGDQNVQLFPTPSDPTGPILTRVQGPRPDLGLYERIIGNSPPDQYYREDDPPVTLSFEGVEYNADARVRETYNWVSLSIDEIAARKQIECDAYAEAVAQESVRSTSNSNFWISLSETRRNIFYSAAAVLGDRVKDRTGGRDSKVGDLADWATYWQRDLRILLIRDSNGNRILTEVGEVEYGQAIKDMGLYDQALGDAYVNCTNDIENKRATNDRVGLVAIDVEDAAYGWPDYYRGTPSAGVRVL